MCNFVIESKKANSVFDDLYNFYYISLNSIETSEYIPISLNMDLSLILVLNFASLLFFLGLFGILWNKKSIIIIFLCVELMLFGVGLQFLFLCDKLTINIYYYESIYRLIVSGEKSGAKYYVISIIQLDN